MVCAQYAPELGARQPQISHGETARCDTEHSGIVFAVNTPTGAEKAGETMSEETAGTAQAPETQGTDAGQETTPQSNAAAGGTQADAAKTFSQADVDRLIAERMESERKNSDQKAQRAREEAERKAAEEQGKFKELYDAAQAKLAGAEAKTRELELTQARRAAAEKVGLPAALADRLRGETPEEMEADAKAVLGALPKPAAPNINNGQGGAATNGARFDEAERKRLASIYGVSAKHFGNQ